MTTPATKLRAVFEADLASKQPQTRKTYLRSLLRLEVWAETEALDTTHLTTADLERFLAEEGRQYTRGNLNVPLAALRAFYRSLDHEGLIENDPTHGGIRRIPTEKGPATEPIAHLTTSDLAELRACAATLGPEHSLTVCLLHEAPISIAGIARLSPSDLSEDANHRTFLLLGRTPASKTPWPIGDQARRAVETLRNGHTRLISPGTKNPNLLKVHGLLGDTRAKTQIETPDLAAALKGTQRREEQELCEQLRLQPHRLAEIRRQLLPGLRPVAAE